jgi:hypothetical protein
MPRRQLHLARRLTVAATVVVMLVALAPSALAAGPGDEPGSAIPASAGTSQYDSTDMTASGADPASCPDPAFDGPFFNTMWFSYAPNRDALTIVDVNSFVSDGSTDFLAIVFVFAQTGGGRTLIGCSAYPATVYLPAESGTTYLIMVAGLSSTAVDDDPALLDHGGTFDLTITPIRGRVLRDHFHAADTFVDDESCPGSEIVGSFDDQGGSKTFFDATKPRVFTFHISGRTTYRIGDGPIVTVSYHQTFWDYLNGNTANIGVPVKIKVDGKLLSIDAGKVVFGPDGSILFEAGPHPELHDPHDLCELLAG